jgi:putative hemolysin
MIYILIFGILIILSALFSSAETAFFSLTPARVRLMVHKNRFASHIVAKLKDRPRRLLIAILVGNNIVNLFAASYATVVAGRFFDSAAVGIATGLTTIGVLIFGEILPKSLAIAHKEYIATITAWPIYIVYMTLYPVIYILYKINIIFYKIMGVTHGEDVVNEEEIRILTRMGLESGAINLHEHEMIENVFQFDDIPVKEVMTQLENIETISGLVSVEKIAFSVSQIGHSRYPVHEGNDEKFIGYIHVNTIMQKLNSDDRDKPIAQFISPIQSVPASMNIAQVFRRMNKKYSHMFLVEDENREAIGLVTLEDIIEELVGEIIDETDAEDYLAKNISH